MSWWTVLKAVIVLLPSIISMVKEGRIRDASMDEVLEALAVLFDTRIKAAEAARQAANEQDWTNDPNDRANRSGASSGALSDGLSNPLSR